MERKMRQSKTTPGERIVKDIKRKTRKQYSAEEKIRIVLDGQRGEESIAELCRIERIAQGLYYKWSKDLWKLGRSGSPEISPAKPTPLKSKGSALKRVS
jgi:transposase